jgi:hypothetical protein
MIGRECWRQLNGDSFLSLIRTVVLDMSFRRTGRGEMLGKCRGRCL